MLFQAMTGRAAQHGRDTNQTPAKATPDAADAGKISLGGAYRLPARTADAGTIRLGGGFRLPVRRS